MDTFTGRGEGEINIADNPYDAVSRGVGRLSLPSEIVDDPLSLRVCILTSAYPIENLLFLFDKFIQQKGCVTKTIFLHILCPSSLLSFHQENVQCGVFVSSSAFLDVLVFENFGF
jgi:hypothetical protein